MSEALGTSRIIGMTVKVYKFFSYLQPTSYIRFSVVPLCIMICFQFMDLYGQWGNLDILIMNAYLTILFFNSAARRIYLRAVIIMTNRDEFEEFIRQTDLFYHAIEKMNDSVIQKSLKSLTKLARILTFFNFGVGIVFSTYFCIYPLFEGTRRLPYGLYVPGFNIFQSPVYEIIYIVEIFLTAPACCGYIPFTCFFISCTLFSIIQMQTLQQQLRTIKEDTRDLTEIEEKLNRLIEVQQRINAYVSQLNNLVSNSCLVELLTYGLMLIALLFMLNLVVVGSIQFILVCNYIFLILSQSFLWYWLSNELREESMRISFAAYDTPFIDFPISVQKKLILIMHRSQRPLEIEAGHFIPMTLEVFQTLLNTAYSFFNLARTFNK